MTRRLVLAVVLSALASPSLQAQTTSFFHRGTIPTRTALARVGLERQWSAIVPLGYGDERVILISHAGNMLFAQTNRASFHAYESESGRYLWGLSLGRPTQSARAASVNSDSVFVSNSTEFFCLDRATGRIRWQAHLESIPSSGTACDEDFACVGLRTGKMVAYHLRDRSHERPPGPSAGTFAWAWKTDGILSGQPIVTEHVTAFASQDKRVYVATNEKPPVLLFRYLTNGPITGTLAAHGTRNLIVPSGDNNVYAIDLFTGDTRWTFASGAPVQRQPIVTGDDVYILNSEGRLSCVDATTGEARWDTFSSHGQLLALSRGRIYIRSPEGDMIVVDRTGGRVVFDARATRERSGLNLREYTIALTNKVDDRLYYSTASGAMLCLRELGQNTPSLLRDPKAKPFGYIPPEGQHLPAGRTVDMPGPSGEPSEAAPPKEDMPEEDEMPKDEGN